MWIHEKVYFMEFPTLWTRVWMLTDFKLNKVKNFSYKDSTENNEDSATQSSLHFSHLTPEASESCSQTSFYTFIRVMVPVAPAAYLLNLICKSVYKLWLKFESHRWGDGERRIRRGVREKMRLLLFIQQNVALRNTTRDGTANSSFDQDNQTTISSLFVFSNNNWTFCYFMCSVLALLVTV